MNKALQQYAKRFNAQPIRQRGLVGFTLFALLGFLWWTYYAEPLQQSIAARQAENERISEQVATTSAVLADVRQRINDGVYQQKEQQLAKLVRELDKVDTRLREETVELVDPDRMLELMTELVYSDSKLKLLTLKRREVKAAIPRQEGDDSAEPGIYRHVLEIELAGKYLDMLNYMQTLEQLDWQLLWDEIELQGEEHPVITLKLVMSTLSTRKEWIEI